MVTPGAQPRLHGYDVEGDLARHYQPADLTFLALTGELPTPEGSAALGVAMMFLAPVSVGHASAHAAVLSRLCGAPTRSTVGVAAIGLAEQARVEVATHRPLLVWLAEPSHPFPEAFGAESPADDAALERLRAALLQHSISLPLLERSLSRGAALFVVLLHAGIRRAEQLEALLVMARLRPSSPRPSRKSRPTSATTRSTCPPSPTRNRHDCGIARQNPSRTGVGTNIAISASECSRS